MNPASDTEVRHLTAAMRRLLTFAGVLVFLAGVQLFVFPERTERYFAWTIDPPLTAVFLGASYWSSAVFEWVASRQRTWANARISVPTVFTFTTLTMIVTLAHIDKFHLGSDFEAATQFVTWAWIAIYAVVPLTLAYLWITQVRSLGSDTPSGDPLPTGLRALVLAVAVVMSVMGVGLLLAPLRFAPYWPWSLTALTGRAIGAWLFSLGVAAVHALAENSIRRLRPATYAFATFAVLQASALARYHADVRWNSAWATLYVVFLASTLVIGTWTAWLGRTQSVQTPRGDSQGATT